MTYDFRMAKARIRELDDEKARAERARRRFEARELRLKQEEQERAEELQQQKDRARKTGKAAIAEILKRKRGKDD